MRLQLRYRSRWSRNVTVFYLAFLLLVPAGSLFVWITDREVVPRLDQLQRTEGPILAKGIQSGGKYAPQLELRVEGQGYVIAAYNRRWLDSVAAALSVGQVVTVWGQPAGFSWNTIFQLQRGDTLLISYASRKAAREYNNRKTIEFGKGLIIIGAAAGLVGLVIATRSARTGEAT